MAEALRVPVVRDADYPYDESPSLDVVMSYITRSSIQWGTNPRITSAELTETAYLHVITPKGATFLRQRAAQLRVAPPRTRGASSSSVPPPPSSTGTATADADAAVPPPIASDDSDIRRTLDHVLTRGVHGSVQVGFMPNP